MPLPIVFSAPYNISDLFILDSGGRGGIVVTRMKTRLLFINGVPYLGFSITTVDDNYQKTKLIPCDEDTFAID